MQAQTIDSLSQVRLIVPLFSGVLGSLVTLIGNHFYTRWREHKAKREHIFKTLMSTRGFKLFPAHVEALCAVEIEWTGKKDGSVRSAWKAYNHHLNKSIPDDITHPENVAWRNELDELFAGLIVAIGESIGKPQDRTDVKAGTNGPRTWREAEHENTLLRKGLLSVIGTGKGLAIPVSVQYDAAVQQQLQSLASSKQLGS